MAKSLILTGAHIKLYINNKCYKEVQSVSFSVSYNETPIFGIDSPWPQEIASNRIDVSGSVQGLRIKYSGGLQAINGRPLFTDIAASPYVSIRIQDRESGEDIVFIPKCKITRESHSISAKSTYKMNFDFIGTIPYFALDRA
jgi:hypothetical protein